MTPPRQFQLNTRDRWRLALFSLGVFALIGALYRDPPLHQAELSDLSLQESIPDSVLLLIGSASRDSTEESSRPSLYYRSGRFHAAARLLEMRAEKNPTGSDLLLLGSCYFLDNRHTDALLALRRAATALEGQPLEECRWTLAQVYLARGEPDPARDELNWLVAQNAHRADQAASQKRMLESTVPAEKD